MAENDPYTLVEKDGDLVAIPNEDYWSHKNKERYDLQVKRSGIPKNYWDIEFSDYKGDQSLESKLRAEQYSLNCKDETFHNVNLYLVGKNSTQKTMIACNIGKEFIRQGYQVKFIYSGVLIDLLIKYQGFESQEDVHRDVAKLKTETDLLIIDDIFDTEKGIYWKKNPELIISFWDIFLREFLHQDKRIVMTSNYTIETIQEKWGDSLYHLISRDFVQLFFYDDIKNYRQNRLLDIWSK